MITRQSFKGRDGATYDWVDVENPSGEEVRRIAAEYKLHPIIAQKIVESEDRPRIQDFENHTFILLQPLSSGRTSHGEPKFRRLELVLSKQWLLTVHKEPIREIEEVRKAISSGGRAASQGPDFLFYNILSRIIDAYYLLTDSYETRIDSLEESILKPVDQDTLSRIFSIRRDVVAARRILSYTRELLASMLREDFYDLDEQDERYFRDAHFQLSYLLESFETFREFLADLRDSYMSAVSLNLNEAVRKLTVVGTIALPLIVVSGVYGMNVSGLPGLSDPNTGSILIVGMLLFIVAIAYYFRRVRWL